MIRSPTNTPAAVGGLPFDATQIQFTAAGAGAVPRSAQSRLRDSWSVKDDGAAVDGATDDAAKIQSVINDAAASITPSTGQQVTITGVAGTSQLASQITVKRGVRLSAPMMTFRPTAAGINMFLVEPGASLDCLVDTTNVTYTGQAITLDATTSAATFDLVAGKHTELKATMLGTSGQGTAVYYHENDVQGVAYVEANLTINGFSKGLDLFAEGAAGFINGNRFHGSIRAATTAIDVRGAGNPSGNLFDMELQAVGGSTVRGWYVETGSFNLFTGYIWDGASFSTSTVEFAAGAGTQNKALVPGDIAGTVLNSTSDATNVAGRIPVSQAVLTSVPVLRFGGASVGITYGTNSCRYSRIGQRVFFDLQMTLTNKGSSVGAATIVLPVTINVFALAPAFTVSLANNLAAGTTTSLIAFGSTNSTNLNLYRYAAGASTALADTDFTNTTDLRISGSYEY
jgi:hypothetical protein